ncbi:unnamed protein product, partial [Rotaria magnacalcarata]
MLPKASEHIKIRLHYWNCRGRVQTVRYMLEDIAYTNKNVDYKEDFELLEKGAESWFAHKLDETVSGPFHNLPVLNWNDAYTFGQTLTIGQLLARKFNLYGKLTRSINDNDVLYGYIDGVVSCAYTDIISNVLTCIWTCVKFDENNSASNSLTGKITGDLKTLNNLLKKSSTSFYYDQKEPTIADYFVFEAFTIARDYCKKLIPNEEDCQALIKLEQTMKKRPALAKYFNQGLLLKLWNNMDRLMITSRIKSTCEILKDATLAARCPFD